MTKGMRIGRRAALASGVAVLAAPGIVQAQEKKFTIATGVDPSFSAFYVAKGGGIFAKHGLDVTVNTGPSGSAMVAFVVNAQVVSAYGAEQAGILNHNLDPNVVCVADGTTLLRWYGMVGNASVTSLEALKGKRLGVARGSGSEVFWLEVVRHKGLNPADYRIVQVEAPEMVAALERGNIDAFSSWEPWLTRAVNGIRGANIFQDALGILEGKCFVYMNKGWVQKNQDSALAYMRALVEATEVINSDRPAAAKLVSDFLRLDLGLTTTLMPKLAYHMKLGPDGLRNFKIAEDQLRGMNRLRKEVVWKDFFYPDLLQKVSPSQVTLQLTS